jgi:hypothetical protein
MRFTKPGEDVLVITEDDVENDIRQTSNRVHLLKFDFRDPTQEKIDIITKKYPEVNRFIIDDNIRFYNYSLKPLQKKYYVMNSPGTSLISFFRKNNKILLSLSNLNDIELDFILLDIEDLLKNIEVIEGNKEIYIKYKDIFDL